MNMADETLALREPASGREDSKKEKMKENTFRQC